MCGRYTEFSTIDQLHEWLKFNNALDLSPRYNIRPSTLCPVITNVNGEPVASWMRWGFQPHWMTRDYMKAKKRYPMINARAESLFKTPAFKASAKSKRCLVIANGFYEPKGPKGTKNRPQFYFQFPDQRPFCFAGVWTERTDEDGEVHQTFAIVTTKPNDTVSPIHDRMPVILGSEDHAFWLDTEYEDLEAVEQLLAPWSGDTLNCWQVSTYVNQRESEGPKCIEELVA